MTNETEKEFIFVDESGDPGVAGNPIYILIGLHTLERTLDQIRRHLANFRYHHDVVREFKGQGWADKLSPPTRHLLNFMADITDEGEVVTTANWLTKETYRNGNGPYLFVPGQAQEFRAYQLRRLLERHRPRRQWSERLDVVIDRWRMNLDQRRNLEDYLRGNWVLRPIISTITTVDSAYADPIQVVDIYARVARRVVEGKADAEEQALCARLMDLAEIRGGLY